MSEFGSVVRQIRNHSSLTLKEVADSSGISIAYLSQIELGDRLPGNDCAERIATALKMNWTTLEESLMNDRMPDGWKAVRA